MCTNTHEYGERVSVPLAVWQVSVCKWGQCGRRAAVWLAGVVSKAADSDDTQSQRSSGVAATVWPPNTPDIQSLRTQGDSFPNKPRWPKMMHGDFHQYKIALCTLYEFCSYSILRPSFITNKAESNMLKRYSCEPVSTWRQTGPFPLLRVFCGVFQGRTLRHQWPTGAVELERVVVRWRIKRQRVESWKTQTKGSLVIAPDVKAPERVKRWDK